MSETAALAREHGFSQAAARALADAIERGGGAMAQFSHPELGGMGQWSRGGMLMIGTMNDHALKARVAALAEALAAGPAPVQPAAAPGGTAGHAWWPAPLGRPSSTGAQNGVRYALFPDRRRIAVEEDGRVTLYDTGERLLTGVSQQQSATRTLSFSGPGGTVAVTDLPRAASAQS